MSTSASPPERFVCNTSPIRHFAFVEQFDLLIGVVGPRVLVPRQVLDPDEDTGTLIESLLSEVGKAERYWSRRSRNPEATANWNRLLRVRSRDDIEVVDLTSQEVAVFAELTSPEFPRTMGFAGRLGDGEAAVLAVAEARNWGAILDDRLARRILGQRSPGTPMMTSRDVLRAAVVDKELLDSEQAQIVYEDMRAKGYRGPESLWEP